MNYYRRIWRNKKKVSKRRSVFCRPLCIWQKRLTSVSVSQYDRIFRTIANHNVEPQKAEVSRKWQTKCFSVFAPSARDSNKIILLIFFSNNYSLTVILFLLLFVFHKTEFKDHQYHPIHHLVIQKLI